MDPSDSTAPVPSTPVSPLRNLRRGDAAWGPFIAFWELTQACQLACKHCLSDRHPFPVTTTEAPHYRRFLSMREGRAAAAKTSARAPLGITDGKGTLFVSHRGEILPTDFLPLPCGRFPRDSVVPVYREHPQFVELRGADRLRASAAPATIARSMGVVAPGPTRSAGIPLPPSPTACTSRQVSSSSNGRYVCRFAESPHREQRFFRTKDR